MKYQKGNFFQVPNRKQLMELDGMSIAVYTMLCARADNDGRCFPSITKLSKDAGVSKDTVIRRLKILEEKGLLSKEKGNSVKSNRYQLLVAESDEVVAVSDYPSSCERLGVVAVSDSNDTHINNNHITINKNEPKHSFGEFKNVKLTDKQVEKLNEVFGDRKDKFIQKLDEYIEIKGVKYKNHCLVLQRWFREETKEAERYVYN